MLKRDGETLIAEHKKKGLPPPDLVPHPEDNPADISRVLPLAFLAPDIVEAILDGRQPPELTAARLKRMRNLPLDWQQQRRYLGFA